jgi:hypothetical protein
LVRHLDTLLGVTVSHRLEGSRVQILLTAYSRTNLDRWPRLDDSIFHVETRAIFLPSSI